MNEGDSLTSRQEVPNSLHARFSGTSAILPHDVCLIDQMRIGETSMCSIVVLEATTRAGMSCTIYKNVWLRQQGP